MLFEGHSCFLHGVRCFTGSNQSAKLIGFSVFFPLNSYIKINSLIYFIEYNIQNIHINLVNPGFKTQKIDFALNM